jgi:hypothetical protein
MNGKTWEIPEAQISEITGKVYTLNGKSYCRVTNTLNIIAKDGLASWYSKVGKKKAGEIIKNRQVFGTNMHTMIEKILLGTYEKPENMPSELEEDYKMFKIFKYNTNLVPEALEQRLWNDEYGYAGTCDYIGKYTTWNPYCMRGHKVEFKDDLVIIDWKTSRSIYKDYWLQMAAYAYAFYKLTGVKVKGAVIVQFRNEQIKVQEKTWEDLMVLFEVYKAVLTVYRWNYNL